MRNVSGCFFVFVSVLVCCVSSFVPAPAAAQAGPVFEVTEVGQELAFIPGDLGNNGAVVGGTWVGLPDGSVVLRASVWSEGTTTILNLETTVPDSGLEMFSWAKAINDDGRIVGAIFDLGGQPGRAFLVFGDTVVDPYPSGLIDFRFNWWEFDMAINNVGQVVVHNFPLEGSGFHPYLVNTVNDEYEVVPLIPEEAFSGRAAALNNHGEILGYYDVPPTYSFTRHPFLRTSSGVPIPVGDPGGSGDSARVADLNDAAQVVGSGSIGDIGQTEAFVWVAPGPIW